MERKELFDLMIEGVNEISRNNNMEKSKAFVKWFITLYYSNANDIFVSDGCRDGKIDCFFKTDDSKIVKHYIINSKFTDEYNKTAPVRFYEEISYLNTILTNTKGRDEYLKKTVKGELAQRYKKLFEYYDEGNAEAIFLTNCNINEAQYNQIKDYDIKTIHLDDLIQFIVDDIDAAMPRTNEMVLYDVNSVLSPDKTDTEVSTSIVFARLHDIVKYMESDPHDLLFARNVRLDLGNTSVNKGIKATYENKPTEFAFSNNGITMLCEHHRHNPGEKTLLIRNPRVVNGSQTLHSIRNASNHSKNARVMLRIIEIPKLTKEDLPAQITKKKDIINKISIRSNQQNPIKLWNLVANDDFQLELYHYFRRKNLFYERRAWEYSARSRELKSVNIERGPELKKMSQYISCYFWNNRKLGPATARNLGKLFDSSTYDLIKSVKPELCYQIYLLNKIVEGYYWAVLRKHKSYSKYKGYPKEILLSLSSKYFGQSKVKFGTSEMTKLLEREDKENYNKYFYKFIKSLVVAVNDDYNSCKKRTLQRTGEELSIANYFKAHENMEHLLKKNIFTGANTLLRAIIK